MSKVSIGRRRRKSDVRSGISLAITFFIISIFLYFLPEYFGSVTNLISVVLLVLGVMLLGVQLNNISSSRVDSGKREDNRGIFDRIGVGVGFFIIWAVLYRRYPITWVNSITSLLLLVGIFGITLGLINLLFFVSEQGDKSVSKKKIKRRSSWSLPQKIVTAISGTIGFIASLMQILEYFNVI